MKIIEKKLDLYVSSILWVHQEFSNEVYILQVYFEPVFEYIFFDESEVYLKWTYKTYVFIVKFWSIYEVHFLNLCIYVLTQKYIWSRFLK